MKETGVTLCRPRRNRKAILQSSETAAEARATSDKLQKLALKSKPLKPELQVTSYKLQATSYKLQATSYKLQATSYKL